MPVNELPVILCTFQRFCNSARTLSAIFERVSSIADAAFWRTSLKILSELTIPAIQLHSYKFTIHDSPVIISFAVTHSPNLGVIPYGSVECISVKRLLGSFPRSEEHTSELQSRQYLVCRLL